MAQSSSYRTRPRSPQDQSAWAVPEPTADPAGLLATFLRFLEPPKRAGELGRLAHYRVLQVLGQGTMGMVLRAEDARLGRQVALKVILPWLAENRTLRIRFVREARALAAIQHDNVVAIYAVDKDPLPFLAMPLLEGEPLSRRLGRGGPLPVAEVLRIGSEMADGLAAAHQVGLVHRDVKPANVWLEAPGGRVKLLDFGLVQGTGTSAVATQAGTVIGTPAFMSPEQARGETVDARSDLFSLGCVVYQMATGELAFGGATPFAVLWAVVTHVPPRPEDLNPEVPPALSLLVERLLAKCPQDRPATARAVADELRAIHRSLATTGGPPLPPAPAETESPRAPPAPIGPGEVVDLAADLQEFIKHRLTPPAAVALPRPDPESWPRWRAAAERGSVIGQFLAAVCLAEGVGVKSDLVRAIDLYQKAAERGLGPAQLALADCYWNGVGVWRNEAEAVRWYRQAADQGIAAAQWRLGVSSLYGIGVLKDEAQGVRWYRQAADQGFAAAANGLGNCYLYGLGVGKDEAEAVRWYRRAADQGYASAQYQLGNCYRNGTGVLKDEAEAVRWYRRAADQGDPNAQFNLAYCLRHGIGVTQDSAEAVRWYRRAAAQGNASAKQALKQLGG